MKIPTLNDDNLRAELIVSGLDFPTSMTSLGPDDTHSGFSNGILTHGTD